LEFEDLLMYHGLNSMFQFSGILTELNFRERWLKLVLFATWELMWHTKKQAVVLSSKSSKTCRLAQNSVEDAVKTKTLKKISWEYWRHQHWYLL